MQASYFVLYFMLVSHSPAPAQAQPIEKAKVAIISARFFLLLLLTLTKNLIKGGVSGQIDENKSYKGYKVRQPTKIQPENVCSRPVSHF
jgi:hypothetical protein